MRSTLVATMLFVLVSVPSSPAKAHPHAWIDVSVRVLFDDAGNFRGIHQTWLFDDFYSMFVLEGAMQIGGGTPSQAALDQLLAENMKNLGEYDFFTEIRSGETQLSTADPLNAETRIVGNRLEMSFELPLVERARIDDMPMSYAIYDPTYYIEMVHAKGDDVITVENAPGSCTVDLQQPSPDPEQTLYAASLGPSETGSDGLGRIFAETVTVTCR